MGADISTTKAIEPRKSKQPQLRAQQGLCTFCEKHLTPRHRPNGAFKSAASTDPLSADCPSSRQPFPADDCLPHTQLLALAEPTIHKGHPSQTSTAIHSPAWPTAVADPHIIPAPEALRTLSAVAGGLLARFQKLSRTAERALELHRTKREGVRLWRLLRVSSEPRGATFRQARGKHMS